jgi:gamma-glutamylcyclotransferase (GGCT)/AIG2-like uncharacterized protein YtfP
MTLRGGRTNAGRRVYFAYGSNLNRRQMAERCPSAVPLRPYELLGFKLTFRRTADIERCFGHTVHGALYDLTRSDVSALDGYEGVARGIYRREAIWVSQQQAVTYVMEIIRPEELPSSEYFSRIKRGYLDWKLPLGKLDSACYIDE